MNLYWQGMYFWYGSIYGSFLRKRLTAPKVSKTNDFGTCFCTCRSIMASAMRLDEMAAHSKPFPPICSSIAFTRACICWQKQTEPLHRLLRTADFPSKAIMPKNSGSRPAWRPGNIGSAWKLIYHNKRQKTEHFVAVHTEGVKDTFSRMACVNGNVSKNKRKSWSAIHKSKWL